MLGLRGAAVAQQNSVKKLSLLGASLMLRLLGASLAMQKSEKIIEKQEHPWFEPWTR